MTHSNQRTSTIVLRARRAVSFVAIMAAACSLRAADLPAPRSGDIHYLPPANESIVPELFHLPEHTFHFQQEFDPSPSPKCEMSRVTFPSPMETPHPSNNTVHCEYFRPVNVEGKVPGVVVLHILGGDFELSRIFCRHLTNNKVSALFLKLPYYGPREAPGMAMISTDPYQTVKGFQQGILDIRRAAAWLGSQPEVDAEQLGIMGISLGGITSALAGTAEPRFKKMFLMLAGGDVGKIGWDSDGLPEFVQARERWLAQGKTREELLDILRPIDPVQYGSNVHERKILMLNAEHDEIVPKACTVALWESFGKPQIIWVDSGHYATRFIPGALNKVAAFFAADPPQ